jgi:hypothetical protein
MDFAVPLPTKKSVVSDRYMHRTEYFLVNQDTSNELRNMIGAYTEFSDTTSVLISFG